MFKATKSQQACKLAAMRSAIVSRKDGGFGAERMTMREIYAQCDTDTRAMRREGRLPMYAAMAYAEIISGGHAVRAKTMVGGEACAKTVTMADGERVDVWLEHGDEGWYIYGEW